MSENFDLLGDPIPEGFGKRGRPPHVPDVKKRSKVMLLLAIGRTDAQIAAALGISEPTLKKHYFRELKSKEEARFRVEGASLLKLYELVEAGNMAAIREMNKVLAKASAADPHFERRAAANAQPGREQKLGKKELALKNANTPNLDTPLGQLMAMRNEPSGKPN